MTLADLQHNAYLDAVCRIVDGLEYRVDDLAPELKPFIPIRSYDHRDVQWLHDVLAARFRLTWLREHKDFGQQAQLFKGRGYYLDHSVFCFQWFDTLPQQLGKLLEKYPNTVRYVLISVLWPNPDKRGVGTEDAFFRDVVENERKRMSVEMP
ncbi:hypothetical protein OR573_08795 [Halomonas sp. CH40]